MPKWTHLVRADLFDYLPTLEENSLDSCIVDPPYGIGFMGREWDTFRAGTEQKRYVASRVRESDNPNLRGRQRAPASSPSAVEYDRSLRGQIAFQEWTEAWAREVLRVLKPGAHLVVCGAPRSFHRMACGIEDAGFEIRDTLMWVFGQGFPKSMNVQQAMNKAARGFPQGGADPTSPNHGKFKSGCTEESPKGRGFGAGAGAFMREAGVGRGDDEGPWQGWGTALKPGWEPIVLARKPLGEKTLQANVERWGVGVLNIDGCRVESNNRPLRTNVKSASGLTGTGGAVTYGSYAVRGSVAIGKTDQGRWPANVLHDGSDDVLDCFPAAPGQLANASATAPSSKTSNVFGKMRREGEASAKRRYTSEGGTNFAATAGQRRFDSGSAARFFYCAKASKADREDGCEHLPPRTAGDVTGGRKEGSAGLDSPRAGAGRTSGTRNFHPTVKPTALMRWLVRLVTPKGGVVLDCFMGSGSTGRAALLEGCSFIGVEREAEYMPIAKARIAVVKVASGRTSPSS